MVNYQTIKISPKFSISVLPSRGFVLSDHQKTEIESIWRHEQLERSTRLFNGQMFNLIQLENDKLIGEFVDYKYYLAQLRNPSFIELLHIRPVCISGITLAGDKILIGQRSSNVTQYQDYYETVPSGGIDAEINAGSLVNEMIDLPRQFQKELWEETGISVTEIKKIEIFSLIYDPNEEMYDLCAEIHVNYSILKESIQPTEEYPKFQWLSKQELKKFINAHPMDIVPLSLHLLKARHFI